MDEALFNASVAGRRPAVVRLMGELDLAGVPELRSALAGLDGDVELDCSGLDFIDGAGLCAVLEGIEACRGRGAVLALVNPSPAVDRLLHIVELDAVLLIRRDRQAS